jgi:undecaprenyl diphosphate synthase
LQTGQHSTVRPEHQPGAHRDHAGPAVGGRAEIADAAAALARDVAAGRVKPERVTERLFARYLDEPDMPDVDLFLRSSGEQRTSNFLIWQSAYAEMVFLDTLFPDFDRRDLWRACEIYASRHRRFGGAMS